MTTLADKFVEAGARAAQPYAFNDAFWLARRAPDHHQRHVQANARRHARDVLLAVLPMVAEDIHAVIGNAWCVGLGDDAESTIREALLALAADLAREG